MVFNQIYSHDVLYILCQCALRIYDSEILYVCYARVYVYMYETSMWHVRPFSQTSI